MEGGGGEKNGRSGRFVVLMFSRIFLQLHHPPLLCLPNRTVISFCSAFLLWAGKIEKYRKIQKVQFEMGRKFPRLSSPFMLNCIWERKEKRAKDKLGLDVDVLIFRCKSFPEADRNQEIKIRV